MFYPSPCSQTLETEMSFLHMAQLMFSHLLFISESVCEILSDFGYFVVVFRDLDPKRIKRALKLCQKLEHISFKSFVCIMLSHGMYNAGCHMYTNQQALQFGSLLGKDQCPTFRNKPKVMIMQSCCHPRPSEYQCSCFSVMH